MDVILIQDNQMDDTIAGVHELLHAFRKQLDAKQIELAAPKDYGPAQPAARDDGDADGQVGHDRDHGQQN